MAETLIDVLGLSVSYRRNGRWNRVVDDVSFSIRPGEAFGLVGESGCGKSTVALQLLGFRHPSLKADTGRVVFKGADLLGLPRPALDRLRGDRIAFVPQNPTTALNPGIRAGDQFTEVLLAHKAVAGSEAARARAAELFELVGLPNDPEFARRYPHELSGGQQQRICIAMALACNPDLVVLDEPTTGLDVTTQEQIVDLLAGLRARISLSMLYVTHDLALLSQIADRIGVMYAGRMVEIAATADLFRNPKHPYTRGLIGSILDVTGDGRPAGAPLKGLLRRADLPPGCPFAPRCDFALPRCSAEPQALEPVAGRHEVACWRWRDIEARHRDAAPPADRRPDQGAPLLRVEDVTIAYVTRRGLFPAARGIAFDIAVGETFALVGESGSGKSTIARAVGGLLAPVEGRTALEGRPLAGRVRDRTPDDRRRIQFIFQNPDASLNPRARIGTILSRPLEFFFRLDAREREARIRRALDDVRLDESYAGRYPDELSGGERQRVAIARALVAEPSLLLCDEILSALDVSVQASVLAMLAKLRAERDIAMLFISHDLAVVRSLADRVGVLYGGELMETGTRDELFSAPFHPYTHTLLMAVPVPLQRTPAPPLRRAPPPAIGQGCVYAGRCPWQAGKVCETERPPWREADGSLRIRCHLPLDELKARAEWPLRTADARLEEVAAP